MNSPRPLDIDRRALVRNILVFCVAIEMLLFTLDYHLYMAGGIESEVLTRLFNTAREDSIAGWVAIFQTGLVAVAAWLICALVRREGARWQARGWMLVAAFFTYLAIDDGAHVHERVGTWFDETAGASAYGAWLLEVFPSYRWQIVFMPAFALMGIFVFGFLMRYLRGWLARGAVVIALGCLAFAVGLDFFEGLDSSHPWNWYRGLAAVWHQDYWSIRTFGLDLYDTIEHFSKSFEETIEMFGMSLFLTVFVAHLVGLADGLQIRVSRGPGRQPLEEVVSPEDTRSGPRLAA